MGLLELEIDMYFWMIDRGDFEDDQRNKVDIEKQKVKLFREHAQRIENGFYVGKLMLVIRKTIIKKSKKPFTLDPLLASLQDFATTNAKTYNWNILATELKKFNIKVTKDQKQQIIDGKQQVIRDILKKLWDYDQNLLAYSVDGVAKSVHPDTSMEQQLPSLKPGGGMLGKPDNQSEIYYGDVSGRNLENVIEREHRTRNMESESHAGHNPMSELGVENPLKFGQNSKSTALLKAAPQKKQLLEPLANKGLALAGMSSEKRVSSQSPIIRLHEVQRIGTGPDIDASINFELAPDQEEQSLEEILNGGANFSGNRSLKGRTSMTQNTQQINDLLETESAAMYIVQTLKMSFGLRVNQVQNFLINNNKYLLMACIKGMKGGDYSKIMSWYKLILNNIGHLIFLLQNELHQTSHTLNVLKSGLFSKNQDVANMTCRVFTKLVTIFNENSQSNGIRELRHSFQDWCFIQQANVVRAEKPPPSPPRKGSQSPQKPVVRQQGGELEQFLMEPGLKAFVRAHAKHQQDFSEQLSAFLLQLGQDNYIDIFTARLRQQNDSNVAYLNLFHSIFDVMIHTQNGRKALIDSGALDIVIDMCFSLVEHNMSLAENQYNSQGFGNDYSYNVDERCTALALLKEIWMAKPDFVEAEDRYSNAILSSLKKGCRDRHRDVSILSIGLMSALLNSFAKSRNRFAPVIYKAMTFILIEGYPNLELRENMLNIFIGVFTQHFSIPINILTDPLLKQIKINIDKQEYTQGNLYLLQQSSPIEPFVLINADFDFFESIAIHQKLRDDTAIQLLDIAFAVGRQNINHANVSIRLVLTILNRFENSPKVFQFLKQYTKTSVDMIAEQDHFKISMYQQMFNNPKTAVHAKKKSLAPLLGIQNNNNTLELPGFTSIASKNTMNAKYKGIGGRDSVGNYQSLTPERNNSVVIGGGGQLGNADYIDDGDIQEALNPRLSPNESDAYQRIITQEKIIVNQLQALVSTGIMALNEHMKDIIIDSYLQTESKLKFRNNALLYLLNLYNKDVKKLIFDHQIKQKEIKAEKARQRKIQKEREEALNTYDLTNTLDNMNPYDSLNNREDNLLSPDIFTTPLGGNININQTPTTIKLNGKLSKMKSNLPVQMSMNAINTKQAANVAASLVGNNAYGSMMTPMKERSRQLSSIDSQKGLLSRQLGEKQAVRALTIGRSKAQEQFKLFHPVENSADSDFYIKWVRGHLKLYKAMFKRYASQQKKNLKSFEDMTTSKEFMSLSEVYMYLNDFKVWQNFPKIKRNDIKQLIQKINLQDMGAKIQTSDLNLESFISFQQQLAYMAYGRIDQCQIFIPMFHKYCKEISLNSKEPLFQRLFEDPGASTLGDPQLIAELERKVNENPNFQLPPGFVKQLAVEVPNITQDLPDDLTEAEKASREVLDDIFFALFGDKLTRPTVKGRIKPRYAVKMDVYNYKKKNTLKPQYMNINDKYQYQNKNQTLAVPSPSATNQRIKSLGRVGGSLASMPTMKLKGTRNSSLTPIRGQGASKKQKTLLPNSVEPELDLTLKVQLAQTLLHPNRMLIREAAYLMDDMIKTIEKGQTEFSPATRHKINNQALFQQKKPINKVTADKLDLHNQERLRKVQDQAKFQRRHDKLKQDLAVHYQDKHLRAVEEQKKMFEDERNKRLKEERLKREKAEYYEQVKREYEENRLPNIQQMHMKDAELQNQIKQQKLQNKVIAEQKIKQQAISLDQQFERDKQERLRQEFIQQQKEDEFKQRRDKINQKLQRNIQERMKQSSLAPSQNQSQRPGAYRVASGRQSLSPSRSKSTMGQNNASLGPSSVKKQQTSIGRQQPQQQSLPQLKSANTIGKSQPKANNLALNKPPQSSQQLAKQPTTSSKKFGLF